jgi:hypothetical protein
MASSWAQRAAAGTGPTFVVLVFVGNSLSTAGTSGATHPRGAQLLADFERQANHPTNQTGTAMELLAFACLMVFAAHLYDVLRRRSAFTGAGVLAIVGAVTMLTVKLASGAPFFAAIYERQRLTPDSAVALNAMNGASFVLSWLPFAVFVGASAVALRDSGYIGRFLHVSGLVLGVAGVALAVIGSVDLESANPLAFLLGALWTLAAGTILTVWPDRVVAPAVTNELLVAA